MKNRKGNYFLQSCIKKTIFGVLLLFISSAVAQTSKTTEIKIISFGDKLKLSNVDQNIVATIVDPQTNRITSLRGNEINNFIFETPGNFEITFKHKHLHGEDECAHNSFPEKMLLKVSSYKMEFDFSTAIFNKQIIPGVNLANTEISLNVDVKSYDNTQFVFENGQMVAAGIGTTIVGILNNNSVVLFPGTNRLTYKISGSATKDTYIMFDFIDINGQIQSYNYPTKL